MVFIRNKIRSAGGALPLREKLAVPFSPLRIPGSLKLKGPVVFPGIRASSLRKIGFADVHLNRNSGGLLRVDHLFQTDRAHAAVHQIRMVSTLIQRLVDTGAQIIFGVADNLPGELFLLFTHKDCHDNHRSQNE